jgi:hypothetical protein
MPLTRELSAIRKAITKCLKNEVLSNLTAPYHFSARDNSGNGEENDPKGDTFTGEDHDTSPIPYL